MNTGFSRNTDTLHDEHIAALAQVRAVADGEETWVSRLGASWTALVATTDPAMVDACATHLAGELCELATQARLEAQAALVAATEEVDQPAPEEAEPVLRVLAKPYSERTLERLAATGDFKRDGDCLSQGELLAELG